MVEDPDIAAAVEPDIEQSGARVVCGEQVHDLRRSAPQDLVQHRVELFRAGDPLGLSPCSES